MTYLFLLLSLFQTKPDKPPILHQTIKTQYLAMYLDSDKTHKQAFWQPIHKPISGGFECRWLPNGDISLTFNRNDKPDLLNRRDDLTKKITSRVATDIKGFKRFGIYSDPNQDPDLFYILYLHPKMPNTILIEFITINSFEVWGSTYFSDQPVNVLQALDIKKAVIKPIH